MPPPPPAPGSPGDTASPDAASETLPGGAERSQGEGKPHGARLFVAASVGILVLGGVALFLVALLLREGETPRSLLVRSPTPLPTVSPPRDLTAVTAPLRVTLQWSQPVGGLPVVGYKVYRDGSLIATVPGPATSYVDEGAQPGASHLYSVVAHSEDIGQSVAVTVRAEVQTPPLGSARLDGVYTVTVRHVSHSGFRKFSPRTFSLRWQFSPTCEAGACDVEWQDLGSDTLASTLRRDGLRYRGTDEGRFSVKCGGTTAITQLDIDVKVVDGQAVATQWTAGRLKGTLTETTEPQLGCGASTATYSVTLDLTG